MYLLISLFCKINNKTWEQNQSYEDEIPFLGQNDQIPLNKISFIKTINIIVDMSLSLPFIAPNCKTILTADPKLWGRTCRSES